MNRDTMGCTTLFFESERLREQAIALAQEQGIECRAFSPSSADPSILVWALSAPQLCSNRTREIVTAHNIPFIGQYDLPSLERPLPDGKREISQEWNSHSSKCGNGDPVRKIWLASIEQCFADETRIRLIAHHEGDIGALLPYLNSIVKSAEYNPEVPVLTYKKGIRMISVYRDKIGIAKADDLLDAWLCLREIKQKIHYVCEHKDEITPNFDMYTPPSALDVYKLLPRTNCGECGRPTCMAFAAAVASGQTEPQECPILMSGEWADGRTELLELMGE